MIDFEHEPTGHYGKLKVGFNTKKCTYYYIEAEPRWIMNIDKDEVIEKFDTGEWILKNHKKLSRHIETLWKLRR